MRRSGILAIVLVMVMLMATSGAVLAGEWYGSQTVTLEPDEDRGLVSIYTATLEYEFADFWVGTFVFDVDPRLGPAYDLSTTLYLPFGKHVYTTLGVRQPGAENNERKYIPYLSVTYRF